MSIINYGSPEGLIILARVMLDVKLPDKLAQQLSQRLHVKNNPEGIRLTDETSTGLVMWLKANIGSCDPLPNKRKNTTHQQEDIVWNELHVFFTGLEETEEMLVRLANEPNYCEEEVARSKIHRAMQTHYISPIDTTAIKVANPKGY